MSHFRIRKKHGKYIKGPIRHPDSWRDALYDQIKDKRRFLSFRIPIINIAAAPDDYFIAWLITMALAEDYCYFNTSPANNNNNNNTFPAHILSEGRGISLQLWGVPAVVIPIIRFVTTTINDNWSKIPGWTYSVTFSKSPLPLGWDLKIEVRCYPPLDSVFHDVCKILYDKYPPPEPMEMCDVLRVIVSTSRDKYE